MDWIIGIAVGWFGASLLIGWLLSRWFRFLKDEDADDTSPPNADGQFDR